MTNYSHRCPEGTGGFFFAASTAHPFYTLNLKLYIRP